MMLGPLYCHPCLTQMGMQPNGSRYPAEKDKLDGICQCCKEPGVVHNIRDYQRRRFHKKPKQVDRKRLTKSVKPKLKTWPEGIRFDG